MNLSLSSNPSLLYAWRPDFSWAKWLEERSHSETVVQAIDRSMVERSSDLSAVVRSVDDLGDNLVEQLSNGFELLDDRIDGLNDTMEWGFMLVTSGVLQVDHSVKQLNASVQQLIDVTNSGFASVFQRLDGLSIQMERIEQAVSDVDTAWAEANLQKAHKAIQIADVELAIEILELTLAGGNGRTPNKHDPRHQWLLAHCYMGTFAGVPIEKIDLVRAEQLFARSVSLTKISSVPSTELLAECHQGQARALYLQGNSKEAEVEYRMSLRAKPTFGSNVGLLKCLVQQERYQECAKPLMLCIAQYRNRFLMEAASDPDLLKLKAQIIQVRAKVLSQFRAILSSYAKRLQSTFDLLETFPQRTTGKALSGTADTDLINLKDGNKKLLTGDLIADLNFVDDPGLTRAYQDMTALANRVEKTHSARLTMKRDAQFDDERQRLEEKIEAVREPFRAKISQIEQSSDEAQHKGLGRALRAFSKSLAKPKHQQIYELREEMRAQIAPLKAELARSAWDASRRRSSNNKEGRSGGFERIQIAQKYKEQSISDLFFKDVEQICQSLQANV